MHLPVSCVLITLLQSQFADQLISLYALQKKRAIDPLPPLDHSEIEYEDFAKDFYEEAPDIAAMTDEQVT